MRIARVALSFFSVGFLAGTFEQASGVGVQHGHRARISAAAGSTSAAPPMIQVADTAAMPAISLPSPREPVPLSPVEARSPAAQWQAPMALDAGDATAAEAILAAF